MAITEAVYTRLGVERIIRAAFEFARRSGRRKVTLADKHNAMPHAHGLWLRTFREVAAEYPEIVAEQLFVDALCLFVVQDPARFDVIVACNLFGDIISDLAAALQGGMGMAPSANLPEALGTNALPLELWEEEIAVPNVFNRMLLYRANLVHSATRYFGESALTARATVLFFWMARD